MFGLIPLTITIVLTAVVLLSMVYFSSDVVGEASSSAEALRYANEADQIINAIKMYTFKNVGLPSTADLITEVVGNPEYYRGGRKSVGEWQLPPDGFTQSKGLVSNVSNESICKAINANIGYSGPTPSCSALPAELTGKRYYCCTN